MFIFRIVFKIKNVSSKSMCHLKLNNICHNLKLMICYELTILTVRRNNQSSSKLCFRLTVQFSCLRPTASVKDLYVAWEIAHFAHKLKTSFTLLNVLYNFYIIFHYLNTQWHLIINIIWKSLFVYIFVKGSSGVSRGV